MLNIEGTFRLISVLVSLSFLLTFFEFMYSQYKKDGIYTIKNSFNNVANVTLYVLIMESFITLSYMSVYILLGKYLNIYQIKSQFTILELITCLLVCDFMFYVFHRAQHRYTFLWRQHSVHHSDKELNLSTTYRFSLIEKLYTPLIFLPVILIGYNPYMVLLSFYIMSFYNFFAHSQYLKLPKFFDYLLVTPNIHSVHHDQETNSQTSNFGTMFSIWDRIFGTFHALDRKVKPGISGQKNQNLFKIQLDTLRESFRDFGF